MSQKNKDTSSHNTSPIITEYKGSLDQPKSARFGIVVSRFNEAITRNLLDGCIATLSKHKVKHIDVWWCPGAYELPLTVQRMAQRKVYDAVIALGAVIRGETYHFEVISDSCVSGLQSVALNTQTPIALGVITPEHIGQAKLRSGAGPDHKGEEAALAALEMATLFRKFS